MNRVGLYSKQMTLLREALSGHPLSRRAAIQAVGIGAAGLAGAALIGCSPEQQPSSSPSSSVSSSSSSENSSGKLQTHRDSYSDYEIQYDPNDWTIKGLIIQGKSVNGYTTEVSVNSQFARTQTIDQYKIHIEQDMRLATRLFAGSDLSINERATTLNGVAALQIEATLPEEVKGIETKNIHLIFVQNERLYDISFMSAKNGFDEEYSKFQQMLKTFKPLE